MTDFEARLARAVADLEEAERRRVIEAIRRALEAATAEMEARARVLNRATQGTAARSDAALARLEGGMADMGLRLRGEVEDASRRGHRAIEERASWVEARMTRIETQASRVEDRLKKAETRVERHDLTHAQLPRAVVLAVVALVAMAIGAGLAVLGAAGRRADVLEDVARAEVEADELRAMGRTLREEYGFGLARLDGEVVLTLPEGSRIRRVVPLVGAVFEQGSTWRIDRD